MSEEMENKISETITQQELDDYLFKDLYSEHPEYVNVVREGKMLIGDIKINYKRKHLILKRTPKEIGRGSFGVLYEYVSEGEDPIKYVAKISINPSDNEKQAIINLRNRELELLEDTDYKSKLCIVPGKIVTTGNLSISIMPLMDGNLIDFSTSLNNRPSLQLRKQIFENVRTQLDCILNLNLSNGNRRSEIDINIEFAYTDLKPDNVLYKLNRDGTYTFLLGDIGSIIPFTDEKGDKFYMTNTPCKRNLKPNEIVKIYVNSSNIISSMRYIFGVFCFKLLANANKIFSKYPSVEDRRDLSTKLVQFLGPSYDNLLYDYEPENRTGMY
jgi:hypothetical protein